MYQISSPWGAILHRWLGVMWSITRIPGGARGVNIKSEDRLRHAYSESFGEQREERKRFIVMSAWIFMKSHLVSGNFGFHVDRPEQKCFSRFLWHVLRDCSG